MNIMWLMYCQAERALLGFTLQAAASIKADGLAPSRAGDYCSSVQDQSPAAEGSHDGEGIRYPIGRFVEDPQPTPEKHERWIDGIAALPGEVRVQGLADRLHTVPAAGRCGRWCTIWPTAT